MDAFLAEVTRLAPIQTRATARESLTASMRLLARAYRGRLGKILRPLLGGRRQMRICEKRSERGGLSRDGRSLARLFAGIESGELRAGLDPDVVLDALYGPFITDCWCHTKTALSLTRLSTR